MAIASSVGLASGINVDEIISKLMQMEGRSLSRVKTNISTAQTKVSSLGSLISTLSSLRSAVTALKSADAFGFRATSSDLSVFSASTSSTATAGTYNIKVNNIAQAQSIYSTSFASESDQVADLSVNTSQKLKIQVGSGTAKEITINSSNNTVAGIRDAINGADAGVRASVINDGGNYKLVLSSNSTGASNRIKIQIDEDLDGSYEELPDETDGTGLSRLAFNATYNGAGEVSGGIANFSQSQIAKDASLVIDGLTVTRSSNTISDLLTGVTISLKKDSAGSTISLNVSKDTDSFKGKIGGLVGALNQSTAALNSLKGTPEKKGVLYSDGVTNSLKSSLWSVTTTSFNNSTLTTLGIAHDKAGTVTLDTSKFDSALVEDSEYVVSVMNAMAASLETTLNGYIKDVIPAKTEGLKSSVRLMSRSADAMQMRLDKVAETLRKRFTTLEGSLSRLQGQGNYLNQQFASMSKINGGN